MSPAASGIGMLTALPKTPGAVASRTWAWLTVPLVFVPVTMGLGWVAWDEEDRSRHAIAYPASAPLAVTGPARSVPDALGRLLGPVRAAVLTLLDPPKSTTQLCALTGLALGSVGRHLGILLAAGLVLRRRAGRAVLYSLTDAGRTLIAASQP